MEPVGAPIDVLVVHGDESVADRLAGALEARAAFRPSTLTDPAVLLDAVDAESFDCLAVALDVIRGWGDDLLTAVDEREPGLPVVVLAPPAGDDGVGALVAGRPVDCYRPDGEDVELLAARIERLVEARAYRRRFGGERPGFETVVDTLPGIVYRAAVHDPWPMTYVGGRVEAITGYTAEAIEAGDVVWGEDVIHRDDAERVQDAVLDALAAGDAFEVTYRIRTADGPTKRVWERGEGIYAGDGEGDEAVALDGFIMEAGDGPGGSP